MSLAATLLLGFLAGVTILLGLPVGRLRGALAELLPLSDPHRQKLLQEDDPHARLDQLLALIA